MTGAAACSAPARSSCFGALLFFRLRRHLLVVLADLSGLVQSFLDVLHDLLDLMAETAIDKPIRNIVCIVSEEEFKNCIKRAKSETYILYVKNESDIYFTG